MTSGNVNSKEVPQAMSTHKKIPQTGIFSAIENLIHRISRWIRWISIAFLFIMMLFVTADVVSRYLVGKPIKGDLEIQELMMVLIVFLAFPYCTLEKRHIYVELLIDRLKGRSKSIVNIFASLIGIVVIIIISWQVALRGWNGITGSENELTLMLNIPMAPFMLIAAAGFIFMSLEWLIDLVHSIARAVNKQAS